MRKLIYALCIVIPVFATSSAYAENDCQPEFTGRHVTLPEQDAKRLRDVLSYFKDKKRKELLAASAKSVQLVRRYVSGGVDARGGNLWVDVKPSQIDKDLVLHIPPMDMPEYVDSGSNATVHQPTQAVNDFTYRFFQPETDGTAVVLNRGICRDSKTCSVLPMGPELEQTISGLLHCSPDKKVAYVFSDGLLITNMELIPWPVGGALFFSKDPSGYKLAALISFQ